MVGNRFPVRRVVQVEGDVRSGGDQLRRINWPVIRGKVPRQITIFCAVRRRQAAPAAAVHDWSGIAVATPSCTRAQEGWTLVWKRGTFGVAFFVGPVSNSVLIGWVVRDVANANVMRDGG